MKYKVVATSLFKKELKIIKKRNKDLEKLRKVVNMLASNEKLDEKYKDHQLVNRQGLKIAENVILNRTGYWFIGLIIMN